MPSGADPTGDGADPVATPTSTTPPGGRTTGGAPDHAGLGPAMIRESARAKLFGATRARPIRVGRYLLRARIGRGAMGDVMLAHDPELDRSVAIKLLHADIAQHARSRDRFVREARALARLDHPNVVPIHDVGVAGDQVWLAMEYIDGATLRQWAHGRARPIRAVLEVLLAAGRGLVAAHQAGLTHRDFKPDNVMVAPADVDRPRQVRVADFGLAGLVHDGLGPGPITADDAMPAGQSVRTHGIVGTFGYIAPEQLVAQPTTGGLGPAIDQFAFCVTAWEILGGQRPFAGSNTIATNEAVATAPRRELPGGGAIPRSIRAVLLRGLAIDPRERWPDMDALLVALGRDPWRTPRRLAIAALAVGGVAWAAMGPTPCAQAGSGVATLWNEPRAAAIGDAFATSGVPGAAAIWDGVAPRIERQAQAWIAADRDACQAHARGEISTTLFDATVACLDRRRAQLGATLELLAVPDAEVVRRALGAMTDFDAIESCAAADRVLDGLDPPAAADADAVARAREQLVAAQALERAGRYAMATAAIDATTDAPEYPPLQAEVALRRGALLVLEERYDDARAALETAFFAAEALGHREVALEAATSLIYCAGYRQARYDEGAMWARHARAFAADATAIQRARIANNEGAMARAKGDPELAITRYEEAARWRREASNGVVDVAAAASLNNLGLALADVHRYDEAIASSREALEVRRRLLGPDHPEVADSLANLSKILVDAGHDDEGESLLREAIRTRERIFGPDHVSVARALLNLSVIDHHRDRPQTAIANLERALSIFEATMGSDHPNVAATRHNLAFMLGELGRWPEALGHAERVLAARRVREGEDAVLTLQTRAVRASALFELGRTDEGIAETLEIQRLHVAARSTENPHVAATHGDLGRMYAALGRHVEAVAQYELALGIYTRVLGVDHPRTTRMAQLLHDERLAAR